MKEKKPFGRPTRRWKIILNYALEKEGVGIWTVFIWFKVRSSEQGNDL